MIASSLGKFTILLKSLSNFSVQFRGFSSSAVSRTKTRDRYDKHEASIRQINRDEHLKSFFMFGGAIQVTEETHEQSFDGSIYKHLNVLYVHSSQNNTIATLVDGTTLSNPHPRVIYSSSCGAIGFKNARKGTTVAAQTLGTAMGEQMLRRKITKVRTVLKGLGPGRLSILKGLSIAGIDIISITDNTILYGHTTNLQRPKKVRRL